MHFSIHSWKNKIFTVYHYDLLTGLPFVGQPALAVGETVEELRDFIEIQAARKNLRLTKQSRTPTIENKECVEVWLDLSPV